MIARSGVRGQKDRRGRSSAAKLPLRFRLLKVHVDPLLPILCRARFWTEAQAAQLRALRRAQAYALRRVFLALIGGLCKKENTSQTR